MEMICAWAALGKIVGVLVFFVMLFIGVVMESDHKRKIIELIMCGVIFVVLMGMQFAVPRLAGPNSQKVRDICTAWDPSALLNQN